MILTALANFFARFQRPKHVSIEEAGAWMQDEAQSYAQFLAQVAESQVGVREDAKNNTGKMVVEFQKATWLQPGPWPWCAAFVCWCIHEAIYWHGLPPRWKRPRTAGAYDLERWAAGTGPYKTPQPEWEVLDPKKTEPKRGDIVTFTWSHVGIVVGYDARTKVIHTVEGNTGGHDYQVSDSTNGDGVFKKTRARHLARKLIRCTS